MLTRRQKDALQFIEAYQREHGGVSPTYQRIADGIGIAAKSQAKRLVDGLVERSFIRRLPRRACAMEIIDIPERRKVFRFNPETKQLEPM